MATACYDHEGNKFRSVNQMCKAWGMNPSLYTYRRDKGMSVEEALTTPSRRPGPSKPCTDHLGNEFPSIKDMCEAWGTTDIRYHHGLARGLSLEKILTQGGQRKEPLVKSDKKNPATRPGRKGKPCTDHKGTEHPSEKAMCEAWGMDQTTFRARMRAGWGLERSLEFPVWSAGGKREIGELPPENRRRIHEETIKAGPKVESLYGKKAKAGEVSDGRTDGNPDGRIRMDGFGRTGVEQTQPGEEKSSVGRKPGELKSAADKPKMKVPDGGCSPNADCSAAAKSAAARVAIPLDATRALKKRGA